MALEAPAWIEHALHVAALQVIDAAEEVSDGCGVIAHAEMDEAPFQSEEWMNVPTLTKVDSWTELPVQNPKVAAMNAHGTIRSGLETRSESLSEIVTHLSLEL